jgi:uncharacterized protein
VSHVPAAAAADVQVVLSGTKRRGCHTAASITAGEAVAQNVFGPITQDIPNFAVTPEEFIASGDKVAVVVRYTGAGKDTGKELDLPVVHVWDVQNGKLARFRQFVDTAKFLEVVAAR